MNWDKDKAICVSERKGKMLYSDALDRYVEDMEGFDAVDAKYQSPEGLRLFDTVLVTLKDKLSADNIIDNALMELHEDADVSPAAAQELQELLNAWADKHGCDSWFPDKKGPLTFTQEDLVAIWGEP